MMDLVGDGKGDAMEKAEWTAAHVNDLPDSSFAYVEPGGKKDADGRTTPRVLRHLPYKGPDGAVDLPHLRNALARLDGTNLPTKVKARVKVKLESAASEHGVGDHEGEKKAEWTDAAFKAENPGSRVQTLVFDQEKYPKADGAKAWATDHGFTSGKVDETEGSFRLRQEDPGAFDHMRTISLTEGVKAVVGYPTKSVEAVQVAFMKSATSRAVKFAAVVAATVEPVEESSLGVVYQVKCAGESLYFVERDGAAVALPLYRSVQKLAWVAKAEEQRYTLGVCYPASTSKRVESDFHGDVMSEAELEKSAWGFISKSGGSRVGLMHRPGTSGAGKVVESYIWRGPEWKTKDVDGTEQTVDPGDWMLGVVWEPEAWAAVKSGNLKGYSLQGAARKEAFE
jgi:hypothetical protein